MKPDQIFNELKLLADKLNVTVLEENFRKTGIKVKSGSCIIKNNKYCIIDKHLRTAKKIDVLAESLSQEPHENFYLLPAVRDLINQFG